MPHEHSEAGCLFCMTQRIYDKIERLKEENFSLSTECIRLKELTKQLQVKLDVQQMR